MPVGVVRSLLDSRASLLQNGVLYVAKYDPEHSPGIHRKVRGTLNAAGLMGYQTRNLNECGRQLRFREILREIITSKEKFIFVRNVPESAIFLTPALVVARLQGRTVLVDVPNPNAVAVREIWHQQASLWRRIVRIAKVYIGGPFSLWPASKIIQHAGESWWFSLGNRRRTVKLGNGIDLSSVAQRGEAPEWPNSELRLVAVATLTFWHGYDRLVRAIATWNRTPQRPYKVVLTLVGDGRARNELETLVRELEVGKAVTFAGMLPPDAVAKHYTKAHLAVGSLGIHRKGLYENPSELKAREYALAGIPFIACGADPDFPAEVPFRILVGCDDGIEELHDVFARFGAIRAKFTDSDICAFAHTNLGYATKLARLGLRNLS